MLTAGCSANNRSMVSATSTAAALPMVVRSSNCLTSNESTSLCLIFFSPYSFSMMGTGSNFAGAMDDLPLYHGHFNVYIFIKPHNIRLLSGYQGSDGTIHA